MPRSIIHLDQYGRPPAPGLNFWYNYATQKWMDIPRTSPIYIADTEILRRYQLNRMVLHTDALQHTEALQHIDRCTHQDWIVVDPEEVEDADNPN